MKYICNRINEKCGICKHGHPHLRCSECTDDICEFTGLSGVRCELMSTDVENSEKFIEVKVRIKIPRESNCADCEWLKILDANKKICRLFENKDVSELKPRQCCEELRNHE